VKIIPWNKPLSDYDIKDIVSKTSLSNLFQGVFSRDQIVERKIPPLTNECGVINLDKKSVPGTHWTCYFKRGKIVNYYDSFDNLPPPREFIKFFEKFEIYYNWNQEQDFNTVICGQLCLCFLFKQFCLYQESK